jgi:hypothetical protein
MIANIRKITAATRCHDLELRTNILHYLFPIIMMVSMSFLTSAIEVFFRKITNKYQCGTACR